MTIINWEKIKYFTSSEFDSPDKPGTGELMNEEFVVLLDKARGIAGIPFKINSGFRTREHNKKVGGVSDSEHEEGEGVDIMANSNEKRFIIVEALLSVGIKRIGIGKNFIHAGFSKNKPSPRIWLY